MKKVLALVLTLCLSLSLLFVNGTVGVSAAIIGGGLDFLTPSTDKEDSETDSANQDDADSDADADDSASSAVQDKFVKYAENSLYELHAIDSGFRSGEFYIKNKKTGVIRYSNPQNRDFNEAALLNADKESSQFLFQMYNEENGAIRTVNSYRSIANGGSVTLSETDNGFSAEYSFEGINITLLISLTDKGFTVSSDFGKVNSSSESIVTNVQILPYFDSSQYGKDGYSFVPDGSGAIIYNNTVKNTAMPYNQKIYGEDLAFSQMTKAVNAKQAYLPVFGAKNDKGGYLAVIEEGEENARVNATSAYNDSMYNTVYSSFDLVGSDKVVLGGSSVAGFTAATELYAHDNPLTDKVKVNYILLEGDGDYSQMAEAYREYLALESEKVSETPSLFLELYGGISRKESVLGIPITRTKKLTTVKEAKEIVSFFEETVKGSLAVSYRNIDPAIISDKIQNKFRIKGAVGSQKNLSSLKDMLDGRLYIENNILVAKKSGNGFSVYKDTAMRINRNNVRLDKYDYATTATSNTIKPKYAIKINELNKIYTKYFASIKKKEYESAFVNLGNILYSDFDTDGATTRADAAKIFGELISKNGKNGMIYAPNAYALASGKYIADTPIYSSGYDLTDEDVPFYQMVISGAKEYSVPSINLETNTDISFLKALESGASLKFTFIYDNITSIKNTDYEYLFGADFLKRKEQALDYQKKLEKAYGELGSRVVKKHKIIKDSVRISEFENGNKAVVNLSDSAVDTEYGKVEPFGYLIVTE